MFKVPERKRLKLAETHPLYSTIKNGNNGAFNFTLANGITLFCIASDGKNWEHVSISLNEKRCPTWGEMCYIKAQFWTDEDTVLQYHPSTDNYINCHPYTLHLWRPINQNIPTPPTHLIGPVTHAKEA